MLHVKTIHSQLYITVHICVCFIISLIHNWKCVRTWRSKIRHSLIRGMMYSKLWRSEYSNFVHRWQYINSIDNGSWRIFHKMSKLVPSLFSKHIFAYICNDKIFFHQSIWHFLKTLYSSHFIGSVQSLWSRFDLLQHKINLNGFVAKEAREIFHWFWVT